MLKHQFFNPTAYNRIRLIAAQQRAKHIGNGMGYNGTGFDVLKCSDFHVIRILLRVDN